MTHLRLTPRNSATEAASKNAEDFGGRLWRRPVLRPIPRRRDDSCGLNRASDNSFEISKSIVCICFPLARTYQSEASISNPQAFSKDSGTNFDFILRRTHSRSWDDCKY